MSTIPTTFSSSSKISLRGMRLILISFAQEEGGSQWIERRRKLNFGAILKDLGGVIMNRASRSF
jgi:hypothetical protein